MPSKQVDTTSQAPLTSGHGATLPPRTAPATTGGGGAPAANPAATTAGVGGLPARTAPTAPTATGAPAANPAEDDSGCSLTAGYPFRASAKLCEKLVRLGKASHDELRLIASYEQRFERGAQTLDMVLSPNGAVGVQLILRTAAGNNAIQIKLKDRLVHHANQCRLVKKLVSQGKIVEY